MVVMMADDRDLIVGLINEVKERINDLRDEHRQDKRDAIAAREAKEARDDQKHAETQTAINTLSEKATLTGGRVSVLEKAMDEDVRPMVTWYRDEGSGLGVRVLTLEQAEAARAAEKAQAEKARAGEAGEKRGKAWMIAKIVGLMMAIAAVVGWLGADKLSALLFRLAVMLGGGHA